MGAMARSASLAGVRLRGPDDLRRRRGASAFLTNRLWRERLGYADVSVITEEEAGEAVAAVADDHDFTAFEYYATDIAGHRMDWDQGVAALEAFDLFLGGVLRSLREDILVVMASDHGNLEDLSTRRHTLNPALSIWRGPRPARRLASLVDVAPAILDHLGVPA
jgi:bisphosphoglycerate-independent phosphoglycerate mutase (AlkP superfamily)